MLGGGRGPGGGRTRGFVGIGGGGGAVPIVAGAEGVPAVGARGATALFVQVQAELLEGHKCQGCRGNITRN